MTQANPVPSLNTPIAPLRSGGNFRWFICALLFVSTAINYVDRGIIGVLKRDLTNHFHWNENDYANIVAAFQFAYAFGYLLAGRMMDRLGIKFGLPLVVALWSLAAAAHGLVAYIAPNSRWNFNLYWTFVIPVSVIAFGGLRLALGIFEGGNFPAAIRTVREWFPVQERALATGIFNTGSTVGAILCPLLVPWMAAQWGWPQAFYIFGALGLLWIVPWAVFYDAPDRHPSLSESERLYIQSGHTALEPEVKISWISLLSYRPVWAYSLSMVLVSPVWWFYLFWIPDFFQKRFGLTKEEISLPVTVLYMMTIFGSILGGWLPTFLIGRGISVNAARKTAFLICALCVLPVVFGAVVPNLWVAVVIVGLAASAHQGFSANLYTIVSDTMPKQTVSSVVGLGGFAGSLMGVVVAKIVGWVLQATGSYYTLFIGAAAMYLVALAFIQFLVPRIEPDKLKSGATPGT